MKEDQKPVVLISGCSSGIGLALAREFAQKEFRVCATALDKKDIEHLQGENTETFTLDVNSSKSIRTCTKAALKKWGRIDILINNAGYGLIGPLIELPLDGIRSQFETNLFGLIALTQAVVPQMIERKSGKIVNIGSVSGILTPPFGGAYSATKAAVHTISDSLRLELAPFGIQVVTVQPGAIKTGWGEFASRGLGKYRKNTSRYSPVAAFIENRAKSHLDNPTSAEELARVLVRAVSKKRTPSLIRIGHESFRLPFLKAVLPQRVIDRILYKKFGLEKLD